MVFVSGMYVRNNPYLCGVFTKTRSRRPHTGHGDGTGLPLPATLDTEMEIRQIHGQKKQYLDLLLLGDEQEEMIDRYLERGDMFALHDDGVKAACVVTHEGDGIYELKNIATLPAFQRRGYGRCLIEFLFDRYRALGKAMLVGTGEVPSTMNFYRACGFRPSHRVERFFTENYDHPIYEDGIRLTDMVYMRREF